jgi:hypothetical protein
MFPPYPTSRPAPRMGGERRTERPVTAAPAAQDVRQPTARRWRDKVRHAVDLTVAFVLLEDAPSDSTCPDPERPATGDRPRSARPSVDDRHPHRKPLRPMPRPRRPGAEAHRPQVCITPRNATPTAPKRRTRLQ